MTDPTQTLLNYRTQTNTRAKWFLTVTAIALLAAVIFKYTSGSTYPPLKIAILVHGLIFWPWFFLRGTGRNTVTVRDAIVV